MTSSLGRPVYTGLKKMKGLAPHPWPITEDIAAHPSLRHQSWSETRPHTSHNGAEHGSVTIPVSGSAGFCCWGLGEGWPFPHVKAWGGTARIITQGHRGTLFRVVFRYLAIAAASSGYSIKGRSLIVRWWSPVRNVKETTQFMSEVDRFLTGKSPKCLRL
jgi:hypothetical protein